MMLGACFSHWLFDILRLEALSGSCLPGTDAGVVSLHPVDPGTRVDQWEYG